MFYNILITPIVLFIRVPLIVLWSILSYVVENTEDFVGSIPGWKRKD